MLLRGGGDVLMLMLAFALSARAGAPMGVSLPAGELKGMLHGFIAHLLSLHTDTC